MQKRKRVIVNPKVQFQTGALFSFFGVLPLLVIFFIGFSYANLLIQNSSSTEVFQASSMEIFQKVFAVVFGGFFLILLVLAGVFSQFLFRVVGPVYRLEMDMKEMLISNQLQKTIKVRKEDELHTLIDTVNQYIIRKAS